MSDNESDALRELQEETRRRRAEEDGETTAESADVLQTVLLIIVGVVAFTVGILFIVDPYFGFRMRVTMSMENEHFLRIWSLDCTEKSGDIVCTNDPGYGCLDHCSIRSPSTTVSCTRVCADPVIF